MPDELQTKSARKDSQLILRINGKARDEFVALCEALDTSAAREIRAFIRSFVEAHAAQVPLSRPAGDGTDNVADIQPKKRKAKRGKKRK
ncbi:MAG: hypothetical protein ACNA7M_01155 [Roseovarius sp.]